MKQQQNAFNDLFRFEPGIEPNLFDFDATKLFRNQLRFFEYIVVRWIRRPQVDTRPRRPYAYLEPLLVPFAERGEKISLKAYREWTKRAND